MINVCSIFCISVTQRHPLTMHEVNSLSTDNGPIGANNVLCHSTQYSLLVYFLNIALLYDYCIFVIHYHVANKDFQRYQKL